MIKRITFWRTGILPFQYENFLFDRMIEQARTTGHSESRYSSNAMPDFVSMFSYVAAALRVLP